MELDSKITYDGAISKKDQTINHPAFLLIDKEKSLRR